MPHTGEVGTERSAAEVVKRRDQSAVAGCMADILAGSEQALPIGLAERDEPHAGRNQIGDDGMEVSAHKLPSSTRVNDFARDVPTAGMRQTIDIK